MFRRSTRQNIGSPTRTRPCPVSELSLVKTQCLKGFLTGSSGLNVVLHELESLSQRNGNSGSRSSVDLNRQQVSLPPESCHVVPGATRCLRLFVSPTSCPESPRRTTNCVQVESLRSFSSVLSPPPSHVSTSETSTKFLSRSTYGLVLTLTLSTFNLNAFENRPTTPHKPPSSKTFTTKIHNEHGKSRATRHLRVVRPWTSPPRSRVGLKRGGSTLK